MTQKNDKDRNDYLKKQTILAKQMVKEYDPQAVKTISINVSERTNNPCGAQAVILQVSQIQTRKKCKSATPMKEITNRDIFVLSKTC